MNLVRRAVLFEVRLYVSLVRWVLRRRSVPAEALEVHGYARDISPVLWLWVFGSAVEIPVVHVLLPWHTAQVVAAVISLWGLLWMLGFLAALRVYPHLLLPAGVRVRHGSSVDVLVPWSQIAGVTHRREDLPSSARTLQPRAYDGGVDLQVGVGGEVNVHLELSRPLVVPTRHGDLSVTEISVLADDPKELVAAVRRRRVPAEDEVPHPRS